jgi:hypothetical protein
MYKPAEVEKHTRLGPFIVTLQLGAVLKQPEPPFKQLIVLRMTVEYLADPSISTIFSRNK